MSPQKGETASAFLFWEVSQKSAFFIRSSLGLRFVWLPDKQSDRFFHFQSAIGLSRQNKVINVELAHCSQFGTQFGIWNAIWMDASVGWSSLRTFLGRKLCLIYTKERERWARKDNENREYIVRWPDTLNGVCFLLGSLRALSFNIIPLRKFIQLLYSRTNSELARALRSIVLSPLQFCRFYE